MRPRDENERQFAADIDRLLRGEESLSVQDDADYAEALQFAQRLMQLRDEPTEQFAGKLRNRLVVKLAEQDARQEKSVPWFVRLFSRPSLRLAVVSTFMVVAAVGLLWRADLLAPLSPRADEAGPGIMTTPDPSAPPETEERTAAPDNDMLTMEGVPPAAVPDTTLMVVGHVPPHAAYSEPMSITFEFRNEGTEPVSLAFFPPAVHIRDAATGDIVYSFAPGERSHAIRPMEVRSYRIDWDQQDLQGSQVQPGRYMIDVAVAEQTVAEEKWRTEMMTVATFSIETVNSGD